MFDEKGVTFDLRLMDVALHLVADPDPLSTLTGPADLGGIEAVRVNLHDPEGGAGTTVVASYARPPGATPDLNRRLGQLEHRPRAVPERRRRSPRGSRSTTTAHPTPDFFATVEAGFSLVVTLDYDVYL